MKTILLKVEGKWTQPISLDTHDDIKVPFEKVEAVLVTEEITMKQALELYPEQFRNY